MSKLEVDAIEPQSGTTLTIGASGDTVNLGSGATLGSGMGKVLQVVSKDSAVNRTTTSTSFVGSGINVNITPSSASNKILIMCNTGSMDFTGTTSDIRVALYKDAAELTRFSAVAFGGGEVGSRSLVYLDSPATTSSINYEIYFKSGNASQTVYLNEGGDGVVSIVAMEIAG